MPLPDLFRNRVALPVIGAPMFLVSHPELVIAQCKAGIPGTFPTLNARPLDVLETWLKQISETVAADPNAAPYGVNLVMHKTNTRLMEDTELTIKYKVPFVITSVGYPGGMVDKVHSYGGLVYHDVTTIKHAKKAIDAGVDGLILVCAGAGGHAGFLSPFAFLHEVRKIFDGTIILAGAMSTGRQVKAAIVMGADFAYLGTRFIATTEANAVDGYKNMIVESAAADTVHTPYFSGVPANYLRPSLAAAGFDPDNLGINPEGGSLSIDGGEKSGPRPWKDLWSAGQGIGAVEDIPSVAELVARMKAEYDAA
jgi:nitronate monooxygenase